MGGSAFSDMLPAKAFPRIPPPLYLSIKARLLRKLEDLYQFVAVPAEAPEKSDHGDLDFLVAGPKASGTTARNGNRGDDENAVSVPHETVMLAIGAKHAKPMEGNRTSNFAVPATDSEKAVFSGGGDLGDKEGEKTVEDEIFYQVDVHVCADKAEFERILFFHSYGDLGMILGLIVRNVGLKWGEKGLEILVPSHPPFKLTDSMDEISRFMGLDMDHWRAGFKTKLEIFQWAVTIRSFTPHAFKSSGQGFRKVKAERVMYAEFVEWVKGMEHSQGLEVGPDGISIEERQQKIHEEALSFFGKREEYEAVMEEISNKSQLTRLRKVFNGITVSQWIGLDGQWLLVKKIMDEVRLREGGEQGVLNILDEKGEEAVRKIVLEVADALGLVPPNRIDLDINALGPTLEKMTITK